MADKSNTTTGHDVITSQRELAAAMLTEAAGKRVFPPIDESVEGPIEDKLNRLCFEHSVDRNEMYYNPRYKKKQILQPHLILNEKYSNFLIDVLYSNTDAGGDGAVGPGTGTGENTHTRADRLEQSTMSAGELQERQEKMFTEAAERHK